MISNIRYSITTGHLVKRCFWTQYRFHNVKMASLLVPPESVRGMTCLDRTAFSTTIELPCLKFRDVTLSKITPILKKYMFKMRNLKPIQSINNETVVYLSPELIKHFEDIKEKDREQLSGLYERFETIELTLNYNNWRTNDLLKAILPEGIDVPTSYSLIGHIVHLNLRDIHLPFKTIIGQVYLDTIPVARTVVNKINIIDTTFRHFAMEVLAGDDDTVTVSKANGCTYELDFTKVYWNPRLSTEHLNLTTLMKRNDALYDVFAGVGPFAIPAARRGIKVLANDLNPESYKWLRKNAITNKVESNFESFNMDGRDFLRNIVKADLLNRRTNKEIGQEYIVMNLPSCAVQFLDVLSDWFTQKEMKEICSQPPIMHIYCFVKANKGEDACKFGQLLVEEKLGCPLNDSLINLHNVRNVSPFKEMIRVSFLLTANILTGEEPATKKLKLQVNSNVSVTGNIAEENGKEQGIAEAPKDQECIQNSDSSKRQTKGESAKGGVQFEERHKTVKERENKTAKIDEQLEELRKEVHQSKPKMKVNNAKHGKKRKVHDTVPVRTDVTTSLVEQMQL